MVSQRTRLALKWCAGHRRITSPILTTGKTSPTSTCFHSSIRSRRLIQALGTSCYRKSFSSKSSSSKLHMYNSLSKNLEPLELLPLPNHHANDETPKGLAWYTCGPTVYAPAHLGHARTYVWLDIIRRVVEYRYNQIPFHPGRRRPPPPLFVLNITDVDDKILASASEAGETPLERARRYEAEFWRDLRALNCLPPHMVTRVTEHVDSDIVPYIQRIMDKGMAYVMPGDGVYFDVRAFEDANRKRIHRYGKLAPPSQATDVFDRQQLVRTIEDATGKRIPKHGKLAAPSQATDLFDRQQLTNDPGNAQPKRDARDFCLWKLKKSGEAMHWESPWGSGRPGWHIECSAMIQAVQDKMPNYDFQVHAGGVDLKFPHHTNEIAQAEAYHSTSSSINEVKEWIPKWLHTGHLHIDGLKMSKSLKNFITIEELLRDEVQGAWSSPADDFRLWCLGLSGSYRGMASYSKDGIDQAKQMRFEKFCQFLDKGQKWLDKNRCASKSAKWTQQDIHLFHRIHDCHDSCILALFSDFDGSQCVKELVQLCDEGLSYVRAHGDNNATPQEPVVRQALHTVRSLLALLGFSDVTMKTGLVSGYSGEADGTGVVGSENVLIDEFVQFRKAVRDAALTNAKESSKQLILELCDKVRDSAFPAIGVELFDGKHDDGELAGSSWSYCIPRRQEATSTVTKESSPKRMQDIPLEDFFKIGSYEGMFSDYDPTGFPLLKADGTELSKRQQKKLRKKQEAHKQRLQKVPTADS